MNNWIRPSNDNRKLLENYNFNCNANLPLFISKRSMKSEISQIILFDLDRWKVDKNHRKQVGNGLSRNSCVYILLLDVALVKSQKSVLELRLALGRLVNFIQLSSKIHTFSSSSINRIFFFQKSKFQLHFIFDPFSKHMI